ncbi:MAG: hypothetical protein NTW78_05905 [Campylobacterales bacterium]|nr:hypothetical protein [Campylobacterales bacterium]
MNELCETREMVERIKDIISKRLGNIKVFDWHVADELGVSQMNLATMIKRDSPPLKEIMLFCNKNWVDPLRVVIKKHS